MTYDTVTLAMNWLERLIAVRDNGPEHTAVGICCAIRSGTGLQGNTERERKEFDRIIKEWPLFSGNCTYPVPHPDISCPERAFNCQMHIWGDDGYGRNRRALLDYLIENWSIDYDSLAKDSSDEPTP